MADLSPLTLRRTFGAYPTGMALIAAQVGGRSVGMLANSFTSVSLEPALVSISFDRTSTTWPVLAGADRFGISVLAVENRQDALRLRRPAADRFTGITMNHVGQGALVLPDAAATLIVRRHGAIGAGDHVLVLFEVLDHTRDHGAAPLVFSGGDLHELSDARARHGATEGVAQ